MTTVTITLHDNQNAKDFVADVERTLGHRIKTVIIEQGVEFHIDDHGVNWPYIPDFPQEEDDQ